MKNMELWKPTKFIVIPKCLQAARKGQFAGNGESIFYGDILAY